MMGIGYADIFRLVLPETIVVIAAFVVLAVDRIFLQHASLRLRFNAGALFSVLGCAGAIARVLMVPQHAYVLDGMLTVNALSQLVQVALLILTVLTVLLSVTSDFTEHVGEFLLLVLLATASMMFLVSSENVLVLFLSLELLSLSLYILAAFNKSNIQSAEAGLKYFLFGGMSAAFMLFGLSLLYGLSNSTSLSGIASALQGHTLDPLLMVALVMTVIGFGFKIAAVPFHLWAPDAYQGAPAPSAALIASGSKVASFVVFAKVLMIGFAGAEGGGGWHAYAPGWVPVVVLVAAASMVLGNVAAIAQSSLRRLLAYSAMAHAGYMLLGILAHTQQSVAALLYYVFTYALTTIGAFGVVAVVEADAGSDKISVFNGLSRRAPALSLCMLVFLLSLAGIPPLAGFFGKFYLFAAALNNHGMGLLWLVILAIAMSAVSLYYYLRVLKGIYVADPPVSAGPLRVPLLSQIVLCLIALAVLLLGCLPTWLLSHIQDAISASVR
jgi:NADH-quinone oxidoreductase subunit N